MKTQRSILFFGLISVLLAACASATKPPKDLPETVPPNDARTIALVWHRDGGIAGFCDTVTIFTDGAFAVEDCSAKPPMRAGQLDAAQLEQLKGWISKFESFKNGDGDGTPVYPDQMFVKISFNGNGSATASDDQMLEISNFAGALAAKTGPVSTAEAPDVAVKARDFLAKQLSISADDIKIISIEAVEWSDACLGIVTMDVMCAQMITPGYRVMLEAQGKSYELHTNESGDRVELVTDPSQVKP